MRDRKWSRRDLLKASTASAASILFAEPLKAAAPPAEDVTPALIEAAKKEGKLSFYSALELTTAERLARTFETKYPGIAVRVERSGAERIFQRIAQEQGSGIKAVDVGNSTDLALHPRSRVRFAPTKMHTSIQGSGNTPAFPAQWLYSLLRALPGERLFCLRRHERSFASPGLSASTAAPEPHDFAVRFRRVRLSRHLRPPHLTARS